LGAREVDGTQSLSNPGETGREFLGISLSGDTVERIQTPSNDFTDL
jgi:hypothetical protein